jgi:hypothetical protein
MNTTKESPHGTNRKAAVAIGVLFILTIGGGGVFWATTIVTSLLPIATKYRAAFSNWSIQTVWGDSLFVGMVIGCCVSYTLLRFFERIPTKNPILKSVIISSIALIIAILLIDVPQTFLPLGPSDALYYFLIGVMFNVARFLFLGLVIGYLYKRLSESAKCTHVGLFPIQIKGDEK